MAEKTLNIIQFKTLFLVGLMFYMVLFSLSFSSAFWKESKFVEDANRIKLPNEITHYGTYEIKEHAWYDPLKIFKETKIKEVSLTNNTEKCVNCLAEGSIVLYKDGKLMEDVLWKRSFDGGKNFIDWTGFTNWQVYVENKNRYIEQDVYETVCNPTKELNKNGTAIQNCSQVKTGTKQVDTGEWNRLDFNKEYSADTYKWKIEGGKKGSTYLDWIIKTDGQLLDKWAVWGNISAGDEAEVVLNSPNDNNINLAGTETFNATANVTGGANLVNMSLWTNETGSWGVRNTTNLYGGKFYGDFDVSDKTDLVAYYSFEESSGDVLDSHSSNDGSVSGSVTREEAGIEGYSYEYDGSGYSQITSTGNLDYLGNPSENYTISFWIKDDGNEGVTILDKRETSGDTPCLLRVDPYNKNEGFVNILFHDVSEGDAILLNSQTTVDDNEWHHIVVVRNAQDNNLSIYTDGKLENSTFLNGTYDGSTTEDFRIGQGKDGSDGFIGNIDEVAIWNRVLSGDEIIAIYSDLNSSTQIWTRTITDDIIWNVQACDTDGDCGFATSNYSLFIDTTKPQFTVENPTGTSNYGAVGQAETLNVTITDTNLDTCWYDYNGTNVTIDGCVSGVKNSTTFILESGNTNMTIYANDSVGNINSTFVDWGYSFFEDSSESHAEVYETESQTIILNITSSETILQITGILNYDGNNYTGTANCDGGECNLHHTFDTPLVSTGETENKTFYWILRLFNGTGSTTLTTNEVNQTVNRIHLEECGGSYTTESLDFKVYNEGNLTRINPFEFNGLFEYWLGSGDAKQNTPVNQSSTADVEMCLSPTNRILQLNSQISYGFSNENITYVDKNYYFYNHSINNVSQEIKLYLLNAEDSTSFILEVEDQTTEAVPNAYIHIKRFYPGEGIFKTVQIAKTDDNGKSVGFYETETVDYKHSIYLGGEIALSTDSGKIVPESVPYTLLFRIGNATQYPWSSLEDLPNLDTSLTFNKTTNITTFSWIDYSEETELGRLLVYQIKHSATDVLICNESLEVPSATVTCNVSEYSGSFRAFGYIKPSSTSDEILVEIINFAISEAVDIFGDNGLIIGWLIILTAGLIFIWNPTAMIISLNVATIFVGIIGFISFPLTYIFAMIAVSIIIMIYLKT